MHKLFTYPQRQLKILAGMLASILILHAIVAPLVGVYSISTETRLATLYGDHVQICKGDKVIYVKWSSLPKEHLPIFTSLSDEMAPPAASWLPPVLLGLLLVSLGIWHYVASRRPITAIGISHRWMIWHGLITHAPPR